MVSQKRLDGWLVGSEGLPQVEEIKCLLVFVHEGGKNGARDQKTDQCFFSIVDSVLVRCGEERSEL